MRAIGAARRARARRRGPPSAPTPSAWVPTTDIFAQGDDLVIRVELAGVDPEDVDLRFSHGVLTVSGHPPPRSGRRRGRVLRSGSASTASSGASITLPEGTQADQIPAEFDDGLVEITVRDGVSPADSTKIALADQSEGRTTRTVTRED